MQRLYKSPCRSLVSGVARASRHTIPTAESTLLYDSGKEVLLDSGEKITVRIKS